MSNLRNKLIRLAHGKPELRGDLLPLIREAASDNAEKLFENWYSGNKRTSAKALLDKWFTGQGRNGITSDIANALSQEHGYALDSDTMVFAEVSNPELYALITNYILRNYGVTKQFAQGIAYQIVYGENY